MKVFLAWASGGTAVALLHRYFLSFASSLPDLDPAAGYLKRTAFNLVQGIAGNEHRISVARNTPIPNEPAPPGQKEK